MAAPFTASTLPLGRVLDHVVHDDEPPEFEPGDVLMFPRANLAFHVAIFGRTGVGKSRFLSGLIQSDIENNVPFGLLDGVGASFDDAVSALGSRLLTMEFEARRAPPALRRWIRMRMERFARRYMLLDFTRPDPLWRWNVVAVPPQLRPEEVVAAMIGVFVRCTETDPEQTRQLLQVVRAILSVLVQIPGAVLRDALDALALEDWQGLLEYLQRKRDESGPRTREPAALKFLRDFFANLDPYQRHQIARSTWNMFNLFLGDPIVAKFVSSPDSTLDLPAFVNGERSLLIKLPPGQDVLTQRLMGGLLLDLLMLFFSKRDLRGVATGRLPRMTLYIDEVAAFAGKSFTQDLTRCRNWGLAIVAAAQHFKQSPWHTVDGQALYQAMRGNMGTTIMFRVGMDMALAEAEGIFKPRGDMVARIEEEITISEGSSDGYGTSVSDATTTTLSSSASDGSGETTGSSDGTSSNWDGLGGSTSFGASRSGSRQSSTSQGVSDSRGWTRGESRNQSRTTSRSSRLRRDYYGIEEQTRRLAHMLASAPARQAYVVLANDRAETYRIRTLDVRMEWDTTWGGKDYKEELFALAAPPAPAPEPVEPLDVRVRRLIAEERRRSRAGEFPRPRLIAGGRK